MEEYTITLNEDEYKVALKTLCDKIMKILYVYEQSLINENFHYRSYVYSVIVYASSMNAMCKNQLTDIIINLNSLLLNTDFTKSQIRKVVLDSKNMVKKI